MCAHHVISNAGSFIIHNVADFNHGNCDQCVLESYLTVACEYYIYIPFMRTYKAGK